MYLGSNRNMQNSVLILYFNLPYLQHPVFIFFSHYLSLLPILVFLPPHYFLVTSVQIDVVICPLKKVCSIYILEHNKTTTSKTCQAKCTQMT